MLKKPVLAQGHLPPSLPHGATPGGTDTVGGQEDSTVGEAGLPPRPVVQSELRLLPKLTGQVPVSGMLENSCHQLRSQQWRC